MNNQITIRLSHGSQVQQTLRYAGVYDPASVTKLTVTGAINNYHMSDILSIMGKTLQELDLSDASFEPNSILSLYRDCPRLTFISLPASVPEIRPDMFSRMSSLMNFAIQADHPQYTTENGVLFNKDKTRLVRYPTGREGAYVIPDTVIEIGRYAFQKSVALTSVVIPGSVVNIGRYAFAGCTGLTSVTIPDSVVLLDYNAFEGCTALTSVDMHKSLKYKRNRVFENCKQLPLFIETQNELIKQGKIKKLQSASAYDWIDNLMKNSQYPYKIEKYHKTKLHLSVKVTDKLKLEIPVFYKHFQQIIPELMNTIQRFEKCIRESEIVIYVEDVTYDNKYWKNNKKK